MKYTLLTILLLSIMLFSCKENNLRLSLNKAKENREQLDSLLFVYRSIPADSLKYKALCFLIENMLDKYYLSGYKLEEYTTFIDSIYQIEKEVYNEKQYYADFLQKSAYQRVPLDTLYDLEALSASYLKEHIEEVFLLWEKPWGRHLNFDEFCELLLPYRIGNLFILCIIVYAQQI
ncbi:hypothetical protein [Parabacteroides gordonii]|jgi:hypothetical protein|uniref:hypothetical protein n=1 Tax=Parabacteroides gordonii TaxID=574930 RepID=UPI00241D1677|nr:hypothetical protein [Parabacteroides gordonii]